MICVSSYNKRFPKYPAVSTDGGSISGLWYCGGFQKNSLHGQYPAGFLDRALALFPDAERILHCPSGTLEGPGVTVDRISDGVRRPTVVADAGRLPFRDYSFDLILADPPYTRSDSRKYGCPPFPLLRAMREYRRLLRGGGYLGILHTFVPQFSRDQWELRGLIGVVTGFNRATRIFSIMRSWHPEAWPTFLCNLCRRRKKARPKFWYGDRGEMWVCGRCRAILVRGSRGSRPDVEKVLSYYGVLATKKITREGVLEGLRLPEHMA